MMAPFGKLLGLTLTAIEGCVPGSEEVTFTASDGRRFRLYHAQNCCESVSLTDVCGDVADLVGSPILQAEEVTNANEGEKPGDYSDSWTWTFYKLATIKGSVTLRWLGESNGYYSEGVDFVELV
jgi:hypothetical protein